MSDFKIGDKVICRSDGKVYTVAHSFGKNIAFEGLKGLYHAAAFDLYTETKSTIETYTPSELSEIDELRDRVDVLESLCSDYVEQIEGLDYVLEQHKKALNKFTKLTVLLSENHKVADLVGSQIGDDVVDKIYDYLLSQVK